MDTEPFRLLPTAPALSSGSDHRLFVLNRVFSLSRLKKKSYYANGQRVAMRDGGTVYFLLTDHLGSTAVTADGNGARTAELWYKPWGETRYSSGNVPTTHRFTGQREDASALSTVQ